jgi:hypothetical protein
VARLPKTKANAANADRVTATAVTAVNATAKAAQSKGVKNLKMPLAQTPKAQRLLLGPLTTPQKTAQCNALTLSAHSKLQQPLPKQRPQ